MPAKSRLTMRELRQMLRLASLCALPPLGRTRRLDALLETLDPQKLFASCRCGRHCGAGRLPRKPPRQTFADINSDNPSHKRLLSIEQRELRATRQLRIRALGATGRVAAAASWRPNSCIWS